MLEPIPFMEEIRADVFAYVQPPGGWWLSNAGLVAGSDTVTMIDTAATAVQTRQLLAAVREVLTDRRPDQVVLTHAHGDHANGLSALGDVAVFASASCREEIAADGIKTWPMLFPDVNWGELTAVVPDRDVVGALTVGTAPTVTALSTPAPAHTSGDVAVWLPAARVLFAGDLVNNGVTPLCLGGSISGWLKTLDWLAQFQPEVIVPGHGVVAGPELINQTQDYLHRVLRLAHATVDSGASLTETAANADQSPWAAWAEPERLVVNLHHAVSELTGRPVSITTAIADLLAAYGGYIPTRAPHRASA